MCCIGRHAIKLIKSLAEVYYTSLENVKLLELVVFAPFGGYYMNNGNVHVNNLNVLWNYLNVHDGLRKGNI